jgi:hypothetical protein
MVQFPGYRFMHLCIQRMMTESLPPGYPIRLSADLRMCAPPRSFSQLTTAFIAPELHRHSPWTYIRLAILLIALPSRTFSRPRYMSNIAARGYFSKLQSPYPNSLYDLEVWGFEPQTYGLQSRRSGQLSYTPASISSCRKIKTGRKKALSILRVFS